MASQTTDFVGEFIEKMNYPGAEPRGIAARTILVARNKLCCKFPLDHEHNSV